MRTLTISRLAQSAGVGVDTVRYYERAGLLPRPPRTVSGYREYPPETVKRLKFIRRAKDLGFTLQEIGELLSLTGQREHGVAGVKRSAEAKLKLVRARIVELERISRGLQTLIKACPGHGPLESCPILNSLTTGEGR